MSKDRAEFLSEMFKESQEAVERIREIVAPKVLNDTTNDVYHAVGQKLRELNPVFVATIARGSSDHVANFASYLIPLCTRRLVVSVSPSIVTVLKVQPNTSKQFVIALSQSGSSPDIVENLRVARESGAYTVAIVNDEISPLAKAAEVMIPQKAGKEISVAATKTVLCTMVAVVKLVAEWSEDAKLKQALIDLPATLSDAVSRGLKVDANILNGVGEAFVLSRALGECAAKEVALKLKETCGIHAEGFSTAEVRHGPREIVGPRYLVIALALPGAGEAEIVDAALELQKQGAKVLIFATAETCRARAKENAVFYELPVITDDRLAPIVCLQMLFPWLARAAAALGRNPDQPRNLPSKVVKTF